MIGGILAGHDECDGEVENGVMKFYGMASESAMDRHGNHNNYRGAEGKTVEVPYRGKVDDTIKDIFITKRTIQEWWDKILTEEKTHLVTKDELKEAELKLKQTEYTQPAMLTADLALNRLLGQHGQIPDMVAGHSLGEYAALMVSGILQFHDALRAAAARGTEMGSVDVPDKGLMASITAPYETIEDVLYDLEDYVIPANKNSPLMTVIAGETEGVKNAIKKFDELDFPAKPRWALDESAVFLKGAGVKL